MHAHDLQPQHLARLRDNMAETPAKANSTLKAIGALYRWARELGWARQANPASGLSKLEIGEHQPWSQEALEAFPVACRPIWPGGMLGLYTGQGLGDKLATPHPL